MEDLKAKWTKLVDQLNVRGIPLPILRAPKTKEPSISYTLMVATYAVWMASVVGKVSGWLGGINPEDVMPMFIATSALYFGRKFQKKGDQVTIDEKK